jgi:hypothetical protein
MRCILAAMQRIAGLQRTEARVDERRGVRLGVEKRDVARRGVLL